MTRRFGDLSLAGKLTAVVMLVTVVAICLVCGALIVFDALEYRASTIRQMDEWADVIGANSAAALLFNDQHSAEIVLAALKADPSTRSAWIYDRKGTPFASFVAEGVRREAPPLKPEGTYFGGNAMEEVRRIRYGGEEIGTLFLTSDQRELRERRRRNIAMAMAAVVGCLGLSYVLARRLQTVVSTPILALLGAARRVIEEKHYGIRVEGKRHDEVGLLIDAFNKMLEEIQIRDEQLQRHRETLEEQVEARTAELWQANGALVTARDAAEAASRAKSEFLANMSHEIRTPITAILGVTDLALESELNDDQRNLMQIAKSSGDALLQVINDILDFSKVESGKLDLDAIAFSLPDCVGDCMRVLAVRAHEKGLEVAYSIAADVPPYLLGDPGRLRQVLTNLVGNAIKFTEHGEVVVKVSQEERDGEMLRLRFSVRDTGIGVSEENRAMLFQPFSQADTSMSRRYGGTGLGLAISARLVTLMHGRIWLETAPERGSEFCFTAEMRAATAPVKSAPAPRAELSGLPVLLVDDNATNRMILVEMLRRWKMDVTVASGGEAALETIREGARVGRHFRVLVIDAHMPGMDGFTLAQHIKQDANSTDTVVMMLTSGGQPGDGSRCRQLGISAYLLKPINASELLVAIQQVLAGGEAAPKELVTRHSLREPAVALRLLVAEDNPVNQVLISRLLKRDGHEVALANNGAEAVALATRERFDAILMDVQMPDVDGFRATAAIRAWEAEHNRRTPIIALTAHAIGGYRERCLAAGMDDYLAKPVDVAELRRLLQRFGASGGTSTARRPPAPATNLWDSARALAQTDEDPELLRDIVTIFLEQSVVLLQRMQADLEAGDLERLARAAHSVKGELGCIAAEGLAGRARELERACQEDKPERAAAALAELEAGVQQLRPALQEYLEAGHEAAVSG